MYQPPKEEFQTYVQKEGERFWGDAGRYMITDGYNLDSNSLVIDVGGYKGDFTAHIVRKYNCRVNVYEPAGYFCDVTTGRFADNPKVKVFKYGLEDRDYMGPISRFEDAGSMFYSSFDQNDERVHIHDVAKEITEDVDLMAINCEGDEYGILERLIQTDQIVNVRNLLIQFHPFIADCQCRRHTIRETLKETHKEKYSYDFCWEAWSLK